MGRALRRAVVPVGRLDLRRALPAPAAAHRGPRLLAGSGELDSLFADRRRRGIRPAGLHRQAARRLSAGRRAEGDRRRRGLVPDPGARVPQADAVRAGIDNDLLRWWGQDQLWQSEDARYSADSVRIIPGPISVAGITTMDEPIADILGRFEHAAVERVKRPTTARPPRPSPSWAPARTPRRSSAAARTSPGSAT